MYFYVYIGKELIEESFINVTAAYDIGSIILELQSKNGEQAVVIVSGYRLNL